MCVNVCVCVYVCVFWFVCVYMYVCVVFIYIYFIYVTRYVLRCFKCLVCNYHNTIICVNMYIYIYIYIYMYVCMYVCMFVRVYDLGMCDFPKLSYFI